ncbi:MAG: D-alanyl-D-alanine carboxypeptidase family protein, partial [Moorea sp. SIO3C2]|nr:D-alanyl-D-alanine carboxypeptidase family protein [Moorena sp. SIO3C2]
QSTLSSKERFPVIWVAVIGVGAIVLGAATAILWQPIMSWANQNPTGEPSQLAESTQPDEDQVASSTDSDLLDDSDSVELLGHKFYEEADEASLVPVVGDGSVRLLPAAAESFAEMVAAARADGVRLQPLSGFRTVDEQDYLFFEIKKGRKQAPTERAAVSAPPGYSEHHTGYALDIGDATQLGANVDESFEETAAFEWLQDNAAAYSFELSFDGEVEDGVSYEPWHWRFVGDRHSLETFYSDSVPSSLQLPSSTSLSEPSSPVQSTENSDSEDFE